MTGQLLFIMAFCSQIFLLSIYFPSRVLARIKYVLSHYPPSTHAKLYPKPTRTYVKSMAFYKWINIFNLLLGLAILYFIYNGDLVGEEGINPMLPWAYFMLQMLPTMLLELFGFKLSKLMKKQDNRTLKTTTLQARGLTFYISPRLLTAVALFFLAFVVFSFYLYDFRLDSEALLLSLILLGGHVFYIVVGSYLVYGKRFDPYQSQQDRARMVSISLSIFSYVMIACSVFLAIIAYIDVYQLKSSLPLLMSLFLQFLAIISLGYMLHNNRLEDINFEVCQTN